MKKILVSLMATMFLTFSFGTLSASVIDNGVLVASNDKCGGNGACGSDKKIMEDKCSSERKTEYDKRKMDGDKKCGAEKKSEKCGAEKKSDKCGSEIKPKNKCGSN